MLKTNLRCKKYILMLLALAMAFGQFSNIKIDENAGGYQPRELRHCD
ncbi:MAG: hypothetical protein R3B47_15635 [Bacteroidia bacterium]